MAMQPDKDDNKQEFIDATNEFENISVLEFTDGIKLANEALDLLLNNHFEAAKKRLEPYAGAHIYPSLGFCTVMFMQGAITMESQQIDDASSAAKLCLTVCQKSRKKTTISDSIKIRSKAGHLAEFAKYTDVQCHAELCYAECLLQKALLTFVQDENLLALIKGSLKIRECYMIYKDCWKILQVKKFENDFIKLNFESGVRLGVGCFNLMISMLPSRILKILEFVGFKGNQKFGLNQMNMSVSLPTNVRQPLGTLFLLTYHCFIGVITGLYPYNDHIEEAKRLIAPYAVKYASSALFGLFRARIDSICGKFEDALEGYEKTIACQNEWRNLHDICHWELLWCYVYQGDWLIGMKYAEKLSQQSRWSKATYLYQKGAFLIECYYESSEVVTEDMKEHIRKIFESIPKLMQRFAGKSLPIEKFAAKKSKRFFEEGENLVLPGVELLYLWNGFKILGYNPGCIEKFLISCDNMLTKLRDTTTEESRFYYDNMALTTLLKAVCLRYINRIPEAIDLMNTVMKFGKKIKEDLYILPFTEVELAQIAFAQNRYDDVKIHINNAKSYKGYSLESRLHFRMHGINGSLKKALLENSSTLDDSWDTISIKGFTEDQNHNEIDQFHDCDSIQSDKNSFS